LKTVSQTSRLVSALVSVLIVSSGAQAASLTLGCIGTLTTTNVPKNGVAPEPEKENVSDFSIVVDLDRRQAVIGNVQQQDTQVEVVEGKRVARAGHPQGRAVSGFWFDTPKRMITDAVGSGPQ
jgi:hypothetical protein